MNREYAIPASGNFAKFRASAWALLALAGAPAAAVDTHPGSYIPLPPGTGGLSVYWQHVERNESYANGQLAVGGFRMYSDLTTITYGRFIDLGGYTAAPGFMLTCGNARTSGTLAMLGRTAGCADILVGMPLWVLNDAANGRYLGISPYFVAPTGTYDRNSALNMGDNRWKAGVNVGYVTPLVGNLVLDLVGDVAVNGKNRDYGPYGVTEEEAPVYNFQAHLRYQFSPATRVAATYMHDWGWESTIDGVPQHDRVSRGRYRVSAAQFLDRRNMLELSSGGDTTTNNGFSIDRYMHLRWIHFF